MEEVAGRGEREEEGSIWGGGGGGGGGGVVYRKMERGREGWSEIGTL